jgi:streptogramin lyase
VVGDGAEGARAHRPLPGGLGPSAALPRGSWADLAVAPDGGLFLAGGVSSSSDGVRPWPAGEGVLTHARAAGSTRARAAASLLAVAAVGADEAWAVGAAGVILHQRGESVRRFSLLSGEWLRAVWAGGPDDVWIAGDGATLLHYDGRAVRALKLPQLAADASIAGLAGDGKGALWVASPSGILRVTRR